MPNPSNTDGTADSTPNTSSGTAFNLPTFPVFDIHSGNTGARWPKYIRPLENVFVAFNVTENKQKRALLLHYAGEEVMDVFDTLGDTRTDYDTAKTKLNAYMAPKRNVEYEQFVFREAKQLDTEAVDSYHTRLQQLAKTCEFTDCDGEVSDYSRLSLK